MLCAAATIFSLFHYIFSLYFNIFILSLYFFHCSLGTLFLQYWMKSEVIVKMLSENHIRHFKSYKWFIFAKKWKYLFDFQKRSSFATREELFSHPLLWLLLIMIIKLAISLGNWSRILAWMFTSGYESPAEVSEIRYFWENMEEQHAVV